MDLVFVKRSEESLWKSLYAVKSHNSGQLRDHIEVFAIHRCPAYEGFLENQWEIENTIVSLT